MFSDKRSHRAQYITFQERHDRRLNHGGRLGRWSGGSQGQPRGFADGLYMGQEIKSRATLRICSEQVPIPPQVLW